MCGIVGIAQQPDCHRYGRADLERMADRIVHRGPDDDGFYKDGDVLFGMRRLSIIDIDGGSQPISNEDKTIWVINNGEIFNYRALRKGLVARGHKFSTKSDTEVIVHLYEEMGERFLEKLEGMFALAIWDATKRKLIVARDRMGIKPLYIWRFNGGMAFASEIKSFLDLDGFEAAVSGGALLDHIAIGYSTGPATIFDGVEKLAPGHCLVWRGGDSAIRQYWSIPEQVEEGHSYDDWTALIRDELRRAVESHLVADVPVGTFLSGGIDSSAIAVLMREAGTTEFNTYSIGYSGSRVAEYYSELDFAREVADSIQSNHHELRCVPNVATLLPKLIWHVEEPISDSAITTTYLIAEFAAQSGRVIMSGVGGDELFAGYSRYLGAHYEQLYGRMPRWFRNGMMPAVAKLLPSGRQNLFMDKARHAKRFIQAGRLAPEERYAYYLAITDRQICQELLGNTANTHRNGLESIAMAEDCEDPLLRYLRIDWQSQLSENLLLLTDKLTMACSLECRVPFLDHRLVELAARIPAAYKMPNGRLKGLLKDALSPVLPQSVIHRRKRGFGAPVGAWFKTELVPIIDVLLGEQSVVARGFFEPAVIERIRRAHQRNRQDYSDLLLALINIEIWARLFLDGQSHQDISGELSERAAP